MARHGDALIYHSKKRPGKIEVVPSKPCSTALDLGLAYTPGVAEPCMAIHEDPNAANKYTAKSNLVAVISNGTAVLGLGDIGPLAAKPVMEGKGILFKKFADIDVFDIEVDEKDPDAFIETVQRIAPTFGGINLEDIKAPECFYIEQELKKRLPIPVFHDDQHGTAIITGAALLNALELVKKDISTIKVAVSGCGAAAQSCIRFYFALGVKPENVWVADKFGVLYEGREEGVDDTLVPFLRKTDKRTLSDIMENADVFLGLSVGKIVTPEMLKAMAPNPVVFALANPTPEISYMEATYARPDAIVATGRSDFPNQVNNVLGFPFIFRGALDTQAHAINEEMKIAAAQAIANLAKEEVPDSVVKAYAQTQFKFGPDYIIPKPFDPRVLLWVTPAVAEAATRTGVARKPLEDIQAYREELEERFDHARGALHVAYNRSKKSDVKLVFPEGDNDLILQAARIVQQEGIAEPILLGNEERIRAVMAEFNVDIPDATILDPVKQENHKAFIYAYFAMRQRKGVTLAESERAFRSRGYYGSMMVRYGLADGIITGATRAYPNAIKPILECIDTKDGARAMGMYMLAFQNDVKFLCDTTLNIDPSAEQLSQIAIQTADRVAQDFGIVPRVAMLSFSNFGSVDHPSPRKVALATQMIKQRRPDIEVDGEMQGDVALDAEKRLTHFPFTSLRQNANVLIFADLQSANIAYKLLHKLADAEAVGPILLGFKQAVNVCQMNASVNEVVHMCAITAAQAHKLKDENGLGAV